MEIGINASQPLSFKNSIPGMNLLGGLDLSDTGAASQARDTFESNASSAQKTYPFIVIPPNQPKIAISTDQLDRRVSTDLSKLNIKPHEGIPLVGGITVEIDEETKKRLEGMGYKVIIDEKASLIPAKPWEKNKDNANGIESPDSVDSAQECEDISSPKALSETHYATPLASKFTGKGTTIAFLDTGIYPHPDFTTPKNRIVAFHDVINGKSLPYDDNGHGTQCTGISAGNGHMSEGLYRGPAPESNIVSVKVLDKTGAGKKSDILKGLSWVMENKDRYNIKIINLSLGIQAKPNYQDDLVEQAVEKLVNAGITVVASAGNEGPFEGTISAPGDNPRVITVGAADDKGTLTTEDDKMLDFSSRGPTLAGITKPDLVAPGEIVIGPNAPNSPVEERALRYKSNRDMLEWLDGMPESQLTSIPDETLRMIGFPQSSIDAFNSSIYGAKQELRKQMQATSKMPIIDNVYVGSPGTSMATTVVSGVVAQLLEANPKLTPDQIKDILKGTADRIPGYGLNVQGAGMLDIEEALQKAVDLKK